MKYLNLSLFGIFLLIGNLSSSAQSNVQGESENSLSVQGNTVNKSPLFKSKGFQKAIAVPLLLTAAGLYSLTDNDIINKYAVQEERNEWIPNYNNHADDYLQYAPIVAVYGMNALGIKGENNFGNRTALLIKSELLVGVLTYSLKRITTVPRPDTGHPTSFPSGHTAQAFAAATFMSKEYGHKSIWYSVGAYAIATSIGTMRIMNNRHWVSDVLVGAGIGIFSTNMAYLTHQYKWRRSHKKFSGMLVAPTYGQRSLGVYIMMPIR